MICDILGVQLVDFTAPSGDLIKGTNLYVAYPHERVVGVKTDKFFIKQSIDCTRIKSGDTINISFNRFGKVDSLEIVKD